VSRETWTVVLAAVTITLAVAVAILCMATR
jgi:hypothetical protein